EFYVLPDTSRNLIMKAYAAVGTAIAGRGKEITALTFGDLKRVVDEEGVPAYHVSYDRSKQRTSNSTDRDIAMLKWSLGVQAVDKYLALFSARGSSTYESKKRPADPTTEDRGHRCPTGHSSSSRAPHPQHRSSLQSPVPAPVYTIAVTITGDESGFLFLLQKD
ncbi:hypothetical protein B484DRAFT_432627, partial [Ochromonadaceae sp. CCMP2298]